MFLNTEVCLEIRKSKLQSPAIASDFFIIKIFIKNFSDIITVDLKRYYNKRRFLLWKHCTTKT